MAAINRPPIRVVVTQRGVRFAGDMHVCDSVRDMQSSSTIFVLELRCLRRSVVAALLLVGCLVIGCQSGAPVTQAVQPPAIGRLGMVVSTHHAAAEAGARILRQGGNAIDAAVATAFAVAVAQPFSAGLGGGMFALVRLEGGEIVALDARETAPAAATPTMYTEQGVPKGTSVHGPLAVAVPSFVPGMVELLERYGSMSLPTVLVPAIELAEQGLLIGPYHSRLAGYMRGRLGKDRFPETWRIQFEPFESSGMLGQTLVQADLGRTLRLLSAHGESELRDGSVAQAIVAEVRKQGGLLSVADLRDYSPRWREPVLGRYRGLRVASFPPPSSGGVVLVEALNILEGFDLGALEVGSAPAIHLVSEAMKLAFADRAAFMGDSDFVDVPIARLTSKAYAEAQRARINLDQATSITGPGSIPEDAGTTHLSVTDARGRAVALTMTINTPFGSGITAPGTGIVLNNEMDDFAIAIGKPNSYGLIDTRGANLVAPGKRPLSSMTPTILDREGELFMVSGSPGGPRIISTTLLTVLNVVDWKMNPQEAAAWPRFHHQWDPNRLRVEPETSDEVVAALEARGHAVERTSRRWSAAEVIVVDGETGVHLGGADPRTDGQAVGVDAVDLADQATNISETEIVVK
ncbi:MAG TPA: gamma-glutamyltransferase [Myxococcales bacterium]|nr:gamma-glutamyltransferase [Myxococcales bacterium]HIK84103.1 gamma-glutamyltransferase [Myxococcales bacterium]